MMQKWVTVNTLLFIFISTTLVACNNSTDKQNTKDSLPPVSVKDASIPGNFSTQTTIKLDSTTIKAFLDSFPKLKVFETDIKTFYRNRNYAMAWYDENGMIEQAGNLHNRIQNISDEGLPDTLIYREQFTSLLDNSSEPDAFTELMLTAQYLEYAKKVWEGISEEKTKSLEWLLPRKKPSYQQLLDSLVAGKDVLDNAPVYRQYNLLRNYLKKYKDIKASNEWATVTADKKSYKLKDSSVVISQIRKDLFLIGDLDVNNQSNIFDSSLLQAVKNFQRRFGYKEDGMIGASFITELNFPLEKRIEQIIVNMERSRWVTADPQGNYIVVNIPEYRLHVYENDSLVWNMNVVVGKAQHKTVIFNGDMKYVVFSPYWNVPYSIYKNEVLPGISRNPNYLARHNMERYNGGVRQKPGPNNSLGLVKFLFPNSHNIYLHDSPAKSLFNEDKRAFSHGCIRLAEPKKLAVYLLRNDPNWNEQKIDSAMKSGKEKYVTLKNTIPVFITYFTSWVDRQGKLNFRNDIYKRDERLSEMLLTNPGL